VLATVVALLRRRRRRVRSMRAVLAAHVD